MTPYPIFVQLQNAPVVIVGGGRLAEQRVEKLRPCQPRILLIARTPSPRLCALAEQGVLTLLPPDTDPQTYLSHNRPRFVLITDLPTPDAAALFSHCRSLGIEVNTADRPALCSFILPAVARRRTVTVAVSTGGASPAAACRIRNDIDASLPHAVDDILDWLSALRPQIKSRRDLSSQQHAAVFHALVDAAFSQDRPLTESETEEIIRTVCASA